MKLKWIVLVVGLMFGFQSSCTSDPKQPPKPSEPIDENYEEDGSDEPESAGKSAKSGKSSNIMRVSPKMKAAFNKTYKVDLPFKNLLKAIQSATGAIPNINSIYEYDLDYDLFPAGGSSPQGEAAVIAKTGDKTYKIDKKSRSKLKKHLYYGKPEDNGYCGACFLNMEQIHFLLGVAFYEKPGKSSGFFAFTLKFVKDRKGKTRILPNVSDPRRMKSKSIIKGFKMTKKEIEVMYINPGKVQHKLVMQLNSTLDTEVFAKRKGSKEFTSVAVFKGGVLPPYAAKQ